MTDISFQEVDQSTFSQYVRKMPISLGDTHHYSAAHNVWAPLVHDTDDNDWMGSLIYSEGEGQEILTVHHAQTEPKLKQKLRQSFKTDDTQERYKALLDGATPENALT